MGFSITYVVARWDRPLAELATNATLVNGTEPDVGYSWDRADGWQCLAPEGFYDGELLPPVRRIQAETGGPVLGMYVESSSEWELAFELDGELQRFRPYPGEDESDEAHEEEMTRLWGDDWLSGVSHALAAWTAPFALIDAGAVHAALAVPHVFPENKLADLQRMLTLVPAAGHRWWESWNYGAIHEDEVPGARYAVNATEVNVSGLLPPSDRYTNPSNEVALALTSTGHGFWDRDAHRWAHEPTLTLDDALTALAEELPARGWRAS